MCNRTKPSQGFDIKIKTDFILKFWEMCLFAIDITFKVCTFNLKLYLAAGFAKTLETEVALSKGNTLLFV